MNTFNFWRENRTDKHFTLRSDEVLIEFAQFLKTKDQDWINYYGGRAINAFIGDNETGLNAVADYKEYDAFYELLHPIVLEHIK